MNRHDSFLFLDYNKDMNYIYLLKCANNSYYCGWTNDLEKRVYAHQKGQGAKYTKAFGPVELVYYECFETKIEAMRREYAIKKLNHHEKQQLINNFDDPEKYLKR